MCHTGAHKTSQCRPQIFETFSSDAWGAAYDGSSVLSCSTVNAAQLRQRRPMTTSSVMQSSAATLFANIWLQEAEVWLRVKCQP